MHYPNILANHKDIVGLKNESNLVHFGCFSIQKNGFNIDIAELLFYMLDTLVQTNLKQIIIKLSVLRIEFL